MIQASDPGRDPELATLVAGTRGLQPWRRVFHAVNGVVLAGIVLTQVLPWVALVGLLLLATLAALSLDLVRFGVPAVNRLFFRVLRPLASPREAEGIASSTWYLTGCLVAVAAFPREIAAGSILVLALADPAASWLGRRWGRRRLGRGSVQGSGVFFAVATAVLLPFVLTPAGIAGVLLAAAAATLVEAFSGPFDDNLLVPLVTGAVLWTTLPLL
jgi:dolichol kinase